MALNSRELRSNQRLQAASRNDPPLKPGESGQAVRLLQEALIAVGYPLPRSTRPNGDVDGIYGRETARKVQEFERDHRLAVDRGIAGMQVLTNLDAELREGSAGNSVRTKRPAGAEAAGTHLQQRAVDRERKHRPTEGSSSQSGGSGVEVVVSPKKNPQGVVLLVSPPMTMTEAREYLWPGRYAPPATALQPATASAAETGLDPELDGPSLTPGGPKTRHSEFRLNLVGRTREFWSNLRDRIHRLVYDHAPPFRWPASFPPRLRRSLDAWLRGDRRQVEVRRYVDSDYPGIAPYPALVAYIRAHGRTTEMQLYYERITDPGYFKRNHDLSDSQARLVTEAHREVNEDMIFMITRKGLSPRRARQALHRIYDTQAKLMALALLQVFSSLGGASSAFGRKLPRQFDREVNTSKSLYDLVNKFRDKKDHKDLAGEEITN